jgi:hypothetical protein
MGAHDLVLGWSIQIKSEGKHKKEREGEEEGEGSIAEERHHKLVARKESRVFLPKIWSREVIRGGERCFWRAKDSQTRDWR